MFTIVISVGADIRWGEANVSHSSMDEAQRLPVSFLVRGLRVQQSQSSCYGTSGRGWARQRSPSDGIVYDLPQYPRFIRCRCATHARCYSTGSDIPHRRRRRKDLSMQSHSRSHAQPISYNFQWAVGRHMSPTKVLLSLEHLGPYLLRCFLCLHDCSLLIFICYSPIRQHNLNYSK